MAEKSRETISNTEKVYNELSKMRCEGLFCRRCSCYFSTKDEFNHHIQEHLKETNSGKENFMRFIENYICSKCGQQFEVKSDLIIHYNTVCIDAHFVCKHCRENCENSPFLQMHLIVHHNYSEEMLRDEGYLTDLDDNTYFSRCSFMTSFKRKAFKTPPTEEDAERDKIGGSTSFKAPYTRKYRKSRKTATMRQDLAFNSLDKAHTCWICNASFSRKCVLEIHVQKHISVKSRVKKGNLEASEKCLAVKVSESNHTLSGNSEQHSKSSGTCEITGLPSNGKRAILKPSNVVIRSSVFKKYKLKRKFRGIKSIVSTKYATRKTKTEIPKVTTQNANITNLQQLNESAVPVAWKKIKLNSKVRSPETSDELKDSENLNEKEISQKEGEKKSCKETSKTAGKQDFTCKLCKKSFKDGYKLRRHFLIHTGERPYTCTTCKKTFVRDDHLKRHIKRVCSKTVELKPEK